MLLSEPKKVNLIKYLPVFIKHYREIDEIIKRENIIIQAEWEYLKQAFKNNFIFQTDIYGIAQFEKMMKIYPKSTDTLEDRQIEVYAKWNATIPYTWKWLDGYLEAYFLNSVTRAVPKLFNNEYRLDVRLISGGFFTDKDYRLYLELRRLIPANLILNIINVLEKNKGVFYIKSIITYKIKKVIKSELMNTVPTGKYWINSGMIYKIRKGVR